MTGKQYTAEDLKELIGKTVKGSELRNITGIYMILANSENIGNLDVQGTLVYAGSGEDDEYSKWFNQTKPITPIFNSTLEEEDSAAYDE